MILNEFREVTSFKKGVIKETIESKFLCVNKEAILNKKIGTPNNFIRLFSN